MNRTEWADHFRRDHTVAGFPPRTAVGRFVRERGYGPWYQRDALIAVHKMFLPGRRPFWGVYDYLDGRYPNQR